MPTAPATGEAIVERSVDKQFLELLCSDEDLLQAEFDAIIAAEWPTPPVSLPRPGAGRKPERGRSGRWRAGARPHRQQTHPLGGEAWRRQRSPPNSQPHTQTERQVIATREPTLTR
jgi:hypothetical protein